MANTTPIGTVSGYNSIEIPSDKFGAATYTVRLNFTGNDAKDMKKAIDSEMKASLATSNTGTQAKPPYTIKDKVLTVTFKRVAEVKSKRTGKTWEFTVDLFDSKGKPIVETLKIGEGTKMRVIWDSYHWDNASQGGAGVRMQPNKCQIVSLVQYTTETDDTGFDAVEGGYEAAEKDANPFPDESGDEFPGDAQDDLVADEPDDEPDDDDDDGDF